eukprot:TRINITY_DN372_c0_g1_i1.p2 TRINITY_DN372_c0_g1~~TRINITY_DN372_c0_g1_i1.p2  ORF type:complete len:151 (-),score=9.37 TRINITY_DN372_c0_g1_i1:325-723(-)
MASTVPGSTRCRAPLATLSRSFVPRTATPQSLGLGLMVLASFWCGINQAVNQYVGGAADSDKVCRQEQPRLDRIAKESRIQDARILEAKKVYYPAPGELKTTIFPEGVPSSLHDVAVQILPAPPGMGHAAAH